MFVEGQFTEINKPVVREGATGFADWLLADERLKKARR
jgi:hypothetical protein